MARTPRANRRLAKTALLLAVLILAAWKVVPEITAQAEGDSLPPGGTAVDADAFAPGSCVAFNPTSGDVHETVFLDAGHGGIDPGAVGTTESGRTIYEADETLPVELDATSLLRAQGFRVVVSRTRDSTVVALRSGEVSGNELTLQGSHDDVAARDVCANEAGANVLVGIYFDAGSSASTAGSLTAYDASRPFAAQNERLANLVQADVLAELNGRGYDIPNDGVMDDSGLGSYVGSPAQGGLAAEAASYDHLLLIGPAMSGYFSTPSSMPGTVTEPLYITDPFEGTVAASSAGQQAIAHGIDEAVQQYFARPTAGTGANG